MTRTVAVLAFDGAQMLDITGPSEVFFAGDAMAGGDPGDTYRVQIVSMDGGDVVCSSGLRVGCDGSTADLGDAIDTLIIPGSSSWQAVVDNDLLVATIRRAAQHSRRVVSVCAGALLLGAAGLLDGRRATTHWMFLDDLVERCPQTTVERDPIFVGDGHVYTSAGVTAGIDLSLAMVEADHGPDLARQVARYLVVFMQRPGGQAQFSVRLKSAAVAPKSTLRDLLDAIAADPAADYRLPALSALAGYGERHLTRMFTKELGMSPARYVEQVRIEAARSMLETSDASLELIARRTGLGSVETMRRMFLREVGVAPHAYRQRFRTTGIDLAAG